MQLLLIHFHDLVHHPVQEKFIVAHNHHATLIVQQIFF